MCGCECVGVSFFCCFALTNSDTCFALIHSKTSTLKKPPLFSFLLSFYSPAISSLSLNTLSQMEDSVLYHFATVKQTRSNREDMYVSITAAWLRNAVLLSENVSFLLFTFAILSASMIYSFVNNQNVHACVV